MIRCKSLAPLMLMLTFVGCDSEPTTSPEVLRQRAALTLPTAPSGAITLAEAAEKHSAGELSGEVLLVGRVYAESQDPFEPGKASFLLSVLPEKGHDDPEHADNCPFCKRKAAMAPKAVVQFLGSDGAVLPYDAQELFELKAGDVVTVRGEIESFDLNLFNVNASGIHHGA